MTDALHRRLSFGPSALATPANAITVARLLAAPVVVLMLAVQGPTWVALGIAFVVACTDGLDGWVARRQGATRSGAFLDPLADKAVVLGALLVVAARGEITWIPVALICVREIGMSIYRSLAARQGISIPARRSAKAKTIVQDIAVGLCLVPPLSSHPLPLDVAVWIAAGFTVVTGLQYWADGRAVRRGAAGPGAGPVS